ncbi:MAG: preprotein translocase subunit SecA [Clostridia bacterium]|nr:preprotein translocase subunit SecA [Clostridia bacterium]
MGLINKIFGTYSQRQIKKINSTVDTIEALAEKYSAMSDFDLRGMTAIFKEQLANGKTLDDILPEAFAAVREAAWRVLGKRPYRVQLIGGIVLHQGRIAEMKTGEGKTLVATMPAYLNALTGEGVHIVTVNEYLARRDSEEMGRVYGFMGLSTGLVFHGQSTQEKQDAYNCDILYGTNNELGFDYLRDNMVVYKERMVQRGHAFAIVDEVDSILVDEARTPLIISGAGEKSTDIYERVDKFVRRLKKFVIKEVDSKADYDTLSEDADYIVNEKDNQVILTSRGAQKAEQYFGIEKLTDPENSTLYHHINQAIRAYGVMHRDVEYVVNENGVMIVDAFTGRIMPGRRYSNGLHQAIEAKEGVKIERENKTLATITFQNYFRMYRKLSGMTGTALTEELEFREIYNLDVIEIPTNKPMIRIDNNDVVYKSIKGKYNAIIEQIKACYAKGQPVLVGTISIDKSEELSARLRKEGIPHTVLNAKYHEKEAEIVAQAGKFGAVTISTNMAGRGTDIMLGGNPEFMAKTEMRKMGIPEELIAEANGFSNTDDPAILEARRTYEELYARFKAEIAPEAEKVRAAGGLFILGTERHESRRIDNQLRGRSGRQGDPGESRFFISLEDDLMCLFGSERIMGLIEALKLGDDVPIDAKILSNAVESAQKRIEDQNFHRRKNVLTYDDVMNQQRNVIYGQRSQVLDCKDITDTVTNMIRSFIESIVEGSTSADEPEHWNIDAIRAQLLGYLCTEDDLKYTEEELRSLKRDDIVDTLVEKALDIYKSKEILFGAEVFREVERAILLENVDRAWMEHIDAMDDLKSTVGLQAYAQRDPTMMYRLEGAEMFDQMIEEIKENTVRKILSVFPRPQAIERVQIANPLDTGEDGSVDPKKKTVVRKSAKIGRNDPCPCGSGKKYKNCCGANGTRV